MHCEQGHAAKAWVLRDTRNRFNIRFVPKCVAVCLPCFVSNDLPDVAGTPRPVRRCGMFVRPSSFHIACVAALAVSVLYFPNVQLKTDKAQEIKKLNQQIQMVQSDMSKHREALEDCIRLGYMINRRGSR